MADECINSLAQISIYEPSHSQTDLSDHDTRVFAELFVDGKVIKGPLPMMKISSIWRVKDDLQLPVDIAYSELKFSLKRDGQDCEELVLVPLVTAELVSRAINRKYEWSQRVTIGNGQAPLELACDIYTGVYWTKVQNVNTRMNPDESSGFAGIPTLTSTWQSRPMPQSGRLCGCAKAAVVQVPLIAHHSSGTLKKPLPLT